MGEWWSMEKFVARQRSNEWSSPSNGNWQKTNLEEYQPFRDGRAPFEAKHFTRIVVSVVWLRLTVKTNELFFRQWKAIKYQIMLQLASSRNGQHWSVYRCFDLDDLRQDNQTPRFVLWVGLLLLWSDSLSNETGRSSIRISVVFIVG